MAALPYMPLYVADYLADAAHLTTLQHGAYLLLIMNYWQRGAPLPDDDAKLARIAGMDLRSWKRNRADLLTFFSCVDGALGHSRIDAELAKVEAKSLKCKKAGQASAQHRLNGRSTDAEQTFNHTDTDTSIPLSNDNGADSDQIFWDGAKAFLKPERSNPGAMIGKWCRDYGKPETAEAITRAQLDRPAQRIPYIEGILRKQGRSRPAIPI